MRYASICSGIESASQAWHPLGWQPQFFAENDAFPANVLQHYYPTVPNLGDINGFRRWPDAVFDVLVGGTPCQPFSLAGLREGLTDPRGNLALVYLAIAARYRPKWVVWENVPGVLSADEGRAFGSFIGGLGELGYGYAWRVLDAQYFGLAQRRKRVFVVGCLGGWARAAAVLFEWASLSGHPAPSREEGQNVAGAIDRGAARGGYQGQDAYTGNLICAGVASTLKAEGFDSSDDGTRHTLIAGTLNSGMGRRSAPEADRRLLAFGGNDARGPIAVSTALMAHGSPRFDFESDTLLAFDCKAIDPTAAVSSELAPTLRAMNSATGRDNAGGQVAIAFNARQDPDVYHDYAGPIDTDGCSAAVLQRSYVRRLTPRECERLQGFPDDYTLIPYRGKQVKDAPRYKALGNAMAVDKMAWLGSRIELVESLI